MHDDDIVREMNAYYARCARWHDEYMNYSSNEAMEDLLRPVIAWVEAYVEARDVLEVACGTGNWTQVLSRRARSVTATDVNGSALEIARNKAYAGANVTFRLADAYTLDGIEGPFEAAFAADWWSHIPRQRVPGFLDTLVSRLHPGATVVVIDMLHRPIFDEWFSHYDDHGNRVERRTLPDGSVFEVIKNFTDERELHGQLQNRVDHIEYREHEGLKRWMLAFRTPRADGGG
jgi:demethylmenaquinone methyltransferase/2-methoxy-6-polyprenyl-1,4-benzoquinol methylase